LVGSCLEEGRVKFSKFEFWGYTSVIMAPGLPTVPKVKLGPEGFEVSSLGLGCMGMSVYYGLPKLDEEMIELIRYAVNAGVTFLDTADIYGPHTNEVLVGKVKLSIQSAL
jgi:hypothetical protein